MSVSERINALNAKEVKNAFAELMIEYMQPAFGSIAKRDFDILLFMKLQKLGVIDRNPNIYDLVAELRVTRAKARNLLYEAKLRTASKEDLEKELRKLLQKPIFLKDGDKIAIEIDNPFLTDHLRHELKTLNHITDGSFSPELVKLTHKAYLDLFEKHLPRGAKGRIKKALKDAGAIGDGSFQGVMKALLVKLGAKVADEAGSEAAKTLIGYLGPILDGNVEKIKGSLTTLFEEAK